MDPIFYGNKAASQGKQPKVSSNKTNITASSGTNTNNQSLTDTSNQQQATHQASSDQHSQSGAANASVPDADHIHKISQSNSSTPKRVQNDSGGQQGNEKPVVHFQKQTKGSGDASGTQ